MTDETPPAAVFERVERPVFALDGNWRFTYVNDQARRLLTDRGVLEGAVIWDALPGVMETDVPGTFHEAVTRGETRSTTVPIGGDRRVEFQAFPGEDDGLTVLLEDVTERYRQRQRRRRYEAAFSAAGDPIYVLDDRGRFREVNESMVALTGYPEEELLGESMSLLVDEEELDRAERQIQESLLEGEDSVGTIEVDVETADGDRRTCEVNVALLEGEGPSGAVGVMRDTTERRQRQQRLAVLDRVLRHNIRNEMNVVMGLARIAKQQADEEVAEHIDSMIDKAEDLVAVSQAVRRFSDALDPGVGTAQPRDAVEAVRHIVEDLREEYPDAEIRLIVRETGWMRSHESVHAAVEEVIRNGIEHAGVDTPEVVVTIDAAGDPGEGEVSIEIADNGPGMPDAEREVLTEGGETQLTHASGIGLWLVNWAVTKSGGELSLADNDPQGSVVTIDLPRVAPPTEADPDAEPESPDARADGRG